MKAMKSWKRNAVVAAIVLFVCVAVYLNWTYGQDTVTSNPGIEQNDTKTLGEAELVNGSSNEIEVLSELAEENYFDTARLSRQEARDEALAILQATVDDPNAAAEAVSAASESIAAMAEMTLAESEIESLVAAKGYTDCVAMIGDNSVSVVVAVPENGLQAADVAKITDIVLGQTAFAADQVKIIEAED